MFQLSSINVVEDMVRPSKFATKNVLLPSYQQAAQSTSQLPLHRYLEPLTAMSNSRNFVKESTRSLRANANEFLADTTLSGTVSPFPESAERSCISGNNQGACSLPVVSTPQATAGAEQMPLDNDTVSTDIVRVRRTIASPSENSMFPTTASPSV